MRYRFGDYEFDAAQRELRHRGEPQALEPHVFDLLGYLIRERERAVSKEELLRAVWRGVHVSESSLQRAVSLARAALKQERFAIRTLPRFGYRFTAPVTAESSRPSHPAPLPPARPRYVERRGVHIAFQTLGAGDLDLVLLLGGTSSMASLRQLPEGAEALRQLTALGRVVLFDKRGTGLSDRAKGIAGLEERVTDLRSVLDAVGSERALLIGISEGGPLAIAGALAEPERVAALALVGAFARLSRSADYPHGVPHSELARLRNYVRQDWGRGLTLTALMDGTAASPEHGAWAAQAESSGASPGAALELLDMNERIDVRALLPALRVPTLVLHASEDPVIPAANGRYLAEHIPGSRYVEVPGRDHALLFGGQAELVREVTALARRLTGPAA